MAYEKDPSEIGALWVRTSAKGAEFMTGTIHGGAANGGEDIVCFRAKASERGPTWRILKSQPREGAAPRQPARREAAPRLPVDDFDRPDEGQPSRTLTDEDDIPF